MKYPRPKGLTGLIQSYNIHNKGITKTHLKNRITSYFIQYLINNELQYANKMNVSIQEISTLTTLSYKEVTKQLFKATKPMKTGFLSNTQQRTELAEGLISSTLFMALADRNRHLEHLELISRAQQNTYTPFVTSEVTKQLSNITNHDKLLLEIAKTLMPTGAGIQINNTNTIEANETTNNFLTVESAVDMLNDTPDAFTPALAEKAADYVTIDLPEISAMKQEGYEEESAGNSIAVYRDNQNRIDNELSEQRTKRRNR